MPRGVAASIDPQKWLEQAQRAVDTADAKIAAAQAKYDAAQEKVAKAEAKRDEAKAALDAAKNTKQQAEQMVEALGRGPNMANAQTVAPDGVASEETVSAI